MGNIRRIKKRRIKAMADITMTKRILKNNPLSKLKLTVERKSK